MKKLTNEELKNYYPSGSFEGAEWGYPDIEVVGTWTDKATGEEILINAETLEVLQTISDEDYVPNILIVEKGGTTNE